ncbi:hypothetical protein BIW11_03403 [Tropilaelaps mercedesae]|uniref:Uncharacterized protein n=1 Tax=Tropilaelaps mercedesae TaxID=418985 RepID=A0A1V9XMG2_9ACAR|nr:hypothetical protein BIW11_03403 [Tropilaelaps mercedesae]
MRKKANYSKASMILLWFNSGSVKFIPNCIVTTEPDVVVLIKSERNPDYETYHLVNQRLLPTVGGCGTASTRVSCWRKIQTKVFWSIRDRSGEDAEIGEVRKCRTLAYRSMKREVADEELNRLLNVVAWTESNGQLALASGESEGNEGIYIVYGSADSCGALGEASIARVLLLPESAEQRVQPTPTNA